MKAIGGYFELELPRHEEYHKEALRLNTGRNCLEYILRVREYEKVYIPYYTCSVLLEPFHKLNVKYDFYHIDNKFEIAQHICLKKTEAILYTNYYGLKDNYASYLANKYGSQLIIDNTQAFFSKPFNKIDTFYSCRKFFGVPDGAYLYCEAKRNIEFDIDISYNRFSHLLKRIDLDAQKGYNDYRDANQSLSFQDIKNMSALTQRLMQSIDYCQVNNTRRNNYLRLHQNLKNSNLLVIDIDDNTVPMVYPYMTYDPTLREKLIKNKIYIATYWPNVLEWCSTDSTEYNLAKNILPLPIDQRYSEEDMKKMFEIIKI